MTTANTSQDTVRRVRMELRTGDVLELPGVVIQMVEKSEQIACKVVYAAPKNSARRCRPLPSPPS